MKVMLLDTEEMQPQVVETEGGLHEWYRLIKCNLINISYLQIQGRYYDIIADGTRRDDRTPKLNINQIRSLEDRHNVQYINLDSFGHKSVRLITENLFEISKEKSNRDNSSDFEVEIRLMIDKMGSDSLELFPEHYQTRVIGYRK